MTNLITDLSKHKAVTLLRLLYPIWAIVGLFSIMYVPATLIVPGDAATTASNIMANGLLFRIGIVGSLITQLIQIVVVLVLYQLFKSVNKNHASLMVIFALVGIPIAMLNTLNQVAALALLSGADYLKVFGADQLQALMMFFFNLNEQGVIIASIFWGLWLFPLGYLIYKSGYFPKILGILVTIAGLGYLLSSFIYLLLPGYGAIASVLELLTMGEVIFMAWVVLKAAKLPSNDANKENR
ncbi:MAG: DUF4386 domain-containing protein [Deltaproteobacteria bacterium]|nr:DUF4386 domain-containing protein [Deltaproteobacteria bacterium]